MFKFNIYFIILILVVLQLPIKNYNWYIQKIGNDSFPYYTFSYANYTKMLKNN